MKLRIASYRLLALSLLFASLVGAAKAQTSVEELPLEKAWHQALQYSPELEAARAQVEQAQWALELARVPGRPQLNLSLNGRLQGPTQSLNLGPQTLELNQVGNYSAGVAFRQNVLDFGRIHTQIQSQEETREAVSAQLEERVDEVLQRVSSLYLQVLQAQELVEVAQRDLAARARALHEAERRFAAGTAPKFDTIRAISELSASESALLESENRLAQSKAELASLLGLAELPPLQALSPPELPKWEEQDPEQRPVMRGLEAEVRAADSRVENAKVGNSPSLDLALNYQNQNRAGFQQSDQWSIGLVFSVPLYDGGEARAQTSLAQAKAEEVKARLKNARDQVLLQAETLRLRLLTRYQQMESAELRVESAAESLRLASLRYEAGLSTSLELLETQSAHRRAEQELVASQYRYLDSWFAWRRATNNPPWRPL